MLQPRLHAQAFTFRQAKLEEKKIKRFLKFPCKSRLGKLTNKNACVIIIKIYSGDQMIYKNSGVKLKSAEDRKENMAIVLGGARFSAPEKALIFFQED